MEKHVCELCGKESQQLVRSVIEGTELRVCEKCGKFGKVLGGALSRKDAEKRLLVLNKKKEERPEITYIVAHNYSSIIRNAREKLGLTQEEFGKKIAERASLVHQIESGHLKPSIGLAKKLEKALSIKLVEEILEPAQSREAGKETAKPQGSFVLGDFISVKSRKR